MRKTGLELLGAAHRDGEAGGSGVFDPLADEVVVS
jgi:hypothetical protein